jgi:hypothetical protein
MVTDKPPISIQMIQRRYEFVCFEITVQEFFFKSMNSINGVVWLPNIIIILLDFKNIGDPTIFCICDG